MSETPIYINAFLDEQAWYNTRLKKFVNDKYLSRTKYKELRPYWIFTNIAGMVGFHTHPNNYEVLKDNLLNI